MLCDGDFFEYEGEWIVWIVKVEILDDQTTRTMALSFLKTSVRIGEHMQIYLF